MYESGGAAMIEVFCIRIQYLNGENVVRQICIPKAGLKFDNEKELEYSRRLREMKLQYKVDEKYRKENPGASEKEIRENAPRVSVLFSLKTEK